MSKPKIVCLGGGNAMPKGVLNQLKKYPVSISAICAMLDTGGSSGRLRKDYRVSSPGDIRRALIALANTSPVIENLFNYRFETGDLAGHNFANLLIMALEFNTNGYKETISELKNLLKIEHQVLPATLDKSDIYAELEDGRIIRGETNIDRPKHDGGLKIKQVFLRPEASAYPESITALNQADMIVIGPGDLYSTIAQILLINEIPNAIRNSKAKVVYLCNLMTKHGETNDFTVFDFANQIEDWLEHELDFVLYNNNFPKQRIEKYKGFHPELIDRVRMGARLNRDKFVGENLIYNDGLIEHDPEKVAKALMNLL